MRLAACNAAKMSSSRVCISRAAFHLANRSLSSSYATSTLKPLSQIDPEVFGLINEEYDRQKSGLELIASEVTFQSRSFFTQISFTSSIIWLSEFIFFFLTRTLPHVLYLKHWVHVWPTNILKATQALGFLLKLSKFEIIMACHTLQLYNLLIFYRFSSTKILRRQWGNWQKWSVVPRARSQGFPSRSSKMGSQRATILRYGFFDIKLSTSN